MRAKLIALAIVASMFSLSCASCVGKISPGGDDTGRHTHVVAGATHQRRLDLIVAEHMAAQHAALRQLGNVTVRLELRDADHRVVAPVGTAVALPPRAANGP